MLDEILSSLIYLYIRAAFIREELECMLREDIDNLIEWNRGLAKALLWPICLILLPLNLLLLAFLVVLLCGQPTLFGLDAEVGLAITMPVHFVTHLLAVGLLALLCTLRLEWEPRGFVLALADILHTTPRVLQNIWRAVILLPLVALGLMYVVS